MPDPTQEEYEDAEIIAKGLCCSWCASGMEFCRTGELPKITATIAAAFARRRVELVEVFVPVVDDLEIYHRSADCLPAAHAVIEQAKE